MKTSLVKLIMKAACPVVPVRLNATICELSFADSRPRPRFLTDEAVVITVFPLAGQYVRTRFPGGPFSSSNSLTSALRSQGVGEIVGFGLEQREETP